MSKAYQPLPTPPMGKRAHDTAELKPLTLSSGFYPEDEAAEAAKALKKAKKNPRVSSACQLVFKSWGHVPNKRGRQMLSSLNISRFERRPVHWSSSQIPGESGNSADITAPRGRANQIGRTVVSGLVPAGGKQWMGGGVCQ
ncbi:hypothetical protein B0H13DRAFT_2288101 [Mycena leptocephala]|nr:hypothetical protein B0H13DRAFT_2288101 [Mycena leptocephala]